MLPLSIFRVRRFTVTNAVTFVVYAALGGVLFLLPVQLQVVDGYIAARGRRLTAAAHHHHAGAVGAIRTARGSDRPATPDERRPGGDRARARHARTRGDGRGLRDGRAARGHRARPRARDDGGTAHGDGARRAARRPRGARLRREQRRRATGWPRRRGGPAGARRHHGRQLPAPRRALVRLPDRGAHRGVLLRGRGRPRGDRAPRRAPSPAAQAPGSPVLPLRARGRAARERDEPWPEPGAPASAARRGDNARHAATTELGRS